jgi:two-component system phosphate regulon sensor histidine kinase PhoR
LPGRGTVLAVLLGTVGIPTVLSLSVGVVALALWREGFDIVFGVLVLCFAALVISGTVMSYLLVTRTARLAKLRTDFVAGVGHELRTPLAGILLAVETLELERASTQAEQREVYAMLRREAERLDALVQRVLRWRQLGAGGAPPRPGAVLIGELAAACVAAFETVAAGQSARLSLEVQDALPPVRGEREALRDVFGNLVGNALKFGGDGCSVEFSVRRDDDHIVACVRDDGPGIAPSEQGRIFDEFYRAEGRGAHQTGVGLGLAIVRAVVREHGGRVHVDSEPGHGSTFTVRLPIEEGADGS